MIHLDNVPVLIQRDSSDPLKGWGWAYLPQPIATKYSLPFNKSTFIEVVVDKVLIEKASRSHLLKFYVLEYQPSGKVKAIIFPPNHKSKTGKNCCKLIIHDKSILVLTTKSLSLLPLCVWLDSWTPHDTLIYDRKAREYCLLKEKINRLSDSHNYVTQKNYPVYLNLNLPNHID